MKSVRTAMCILFIVGAGGCAKRAPVTSKLPPSPTRSQANAADSAVARGHDSDRQADPPHNTDAVAQNRIEQLLNRLEDAFFDYNQYLLRADSLELLASDAKELRELLQRFPAYEIIVEGHCDERGSAEYNLALGLRRAESAKNFLSEVGLPSDHVKAITFGKERPDCSDHNEPCWQRNRRVHVEFAATSR